MKSNHHFHDITPTIFDIISTLFLSPHPLYWWYHINCIYEISSSIYVDIISIVYNNIFTIFVPSQALYLCLHPLFPWYHTLCIYDLATSISLTSDTLYKVSHPQFMTSHHIMYDITCTVFLTSLPLYLNTSFTVFLSSRPVYQLQHTHSLYYITPSMYDITFSMHVITWILYDITAV